MDKIIKPKEIKDDPSIKTDDRLRPGLITDDPVFAAITSSLFNRRDKYFPIFSLPRMARNDWEIEVLKRVVSIQRAKINVLFCKENDYGLLAPLRTMSGMDLVALDRPEEISIVLPTELPNKRIVVAPNNYLQGLDLALKQNMLLEISSECGEVIHHDSSNIMADTIVVIEQTNRITDVSAINYAHAKGWDTLIIDSVPKEIEAKLKELFVALSNDVNNSDAIYKEAGDIIRKVVDWEWLESKYKRVQFVTRETPLGLLIESIPVAHIMHLQSELRFVDEYYYNSTNIHSSNNYVPSFFFVEMNSNDLTSEIPEIQNILTDKKAWQFTLGGKYANRENFGLYTKYYPFDLLLISGHGDSPKCREVVYSFEDLRRHEHKIKLLEYYQFGPVEGKKVLVETKEYFLEFDGISWDDKEKLNKIGIGHLMREWQNANFSQRSKLVEYKDVSPLSIEGIALNDGVYFGLIHKFSQCNNPIVIINTCASLLEWGKNINYAGPRALIGTMWPIFDKDAVKFAKSLFNNFSEQHICDAFHIARSSIDRRYTKLAYVYYGTLDSYVPLISNISDEPKEAEHMAKRLLHSFSEAFGFAGQGWLSDRELMRLSSLYKMAAQFMTMKVSSKSPLQNDLEIIRKSIESNDAIRAWIKSQKDYVLEK